MHIQAKNRKDRIKLREPIQFKKKRLTDEQLGIL